jgi:hypothetical protein
MRVLFLLSFGLPLFMACNPSGVEEATGEAITVDPGSEIKAPDTDGLDAIIPKYADAKCAELAELDEAKKAPLTEAATKLQEEANALLVAFDQSKKEAYDGYMKKLMAAYNGEGCGS